MFFIWRLLWFDSATFAYPHYLPVRDFMRSRGRLIKKKILLETVPILLGISMSFGVVSLAAASPSAHHSTGGNYSPPFIHQIATIVYPAPYISSTSSDFSWVDSTIHGYYLADRTNAGVDMINTATDHFDGVLPGFASSGNQSAAQTKACKKSVVGPNGVTTINVSGVTQLWASDGVTATVPVSSVKVFTMNSATSGTYAASIPTGVPSMGTTGTCRTDLIAADPIDGMIIAGNNVDIPPYVSIISAKSNPSLDAVVGQIKFATGTGVETSIFDPNNKMFYVNVPSVGLVEINPRTVMVVHTHSEPFCNGTGLALNPATQQLLISCDLNPEGSILMNARNGKVITRFPQISGSDQEWYDPGMNVFFSASAAMTSDAGFAVAGYPTPEIGVISGGGTLNNPEPRWIGAIATGSGLNMKAVAVDAKNHRIFVAACGFETVVFKNGRVFIGS